VSRPRACQQGRVATRVQGGRASHRARQRTSIDGPRVLLEVLSGSVPPSLSSLRRLAADTAARLAGGPLTEGVRAFLAHLAYLLSADVVATLLTFGLSAWVIRLMGPAEFGLANLVIGASQLVLIPMLFGLHAATARTVAGSATPGPYMGAALVLVGTSIPLVGLVGVALAGPVAPLAGLTRAVLLWSLPLAASLTLQHVVQSMLAGRHRFRDIAIYNVWAAAAYALVIVLGLVADVTWPYWMFVVATIWRHVVHTGLCAKDIWRELRRPSRAALETLARFGGVYTLGSVAYLFALSAIDSLMLNAWHGPAAVGLYGAYYASFNIVASRVTKLVSDVLLPTASAHGAPSRMVGRLGRVLAGPAWLLVPAAMVLARLLFLVYGDAYVFSWGTAALLGLCIYLHVAMSLSGDLMMAGRPEDLRAATAISVVTAVLNIGGNLLLIPPFAVAGSLMATAVASGVGLGLRLAYLVRSGRPKSSA
jgi:O-antigen/teichoic acid export membrane protein